MSIEEKFDVVLTNGEIMVLTERGSTETMFNGLDENGLIVVIPFASILYFRENKDV